MIDADDRIALSRLDLGDLSESEAAALLQRIEHEPDLAEAWAIMTSLHGQLAALSSQPPPAHLDTDILDAGPRQRTSWTPLVALAAGLLGGWLVTPDQASVITLAPGSSQTIEGTTKVHAGSVLIDIHGTAKVSWEPFDTSHRSSKRTSADGEPMKQLILGAGAGALISIAVLEGHAQVTEVDADAVVLEAGEDLEITTAQAPTRSRATRPSAAAPPTTTAAPRREAELLEANKRLKFENALLRGRLAGAEGVTQEWPADVPSTFQEAHVRDAFEEMAGDKAEVLAIDCVEFPCIAFLDIDPEAFADLDEATDHVKLGTEQQFGLELDSFMVADLTSGSGERLMIVGTPLYPPSAEPDADATRRTEVRSRTLLEEAIEIRAEMED